MKFKLDECLDVRLATLFSDAGHDVQTVYQEKLSGAPDERVYSVCLQPVFQVERLKAESRAKQKRYRTRVVGGSVAEDLFDPQITQIDADYKRYPCRVVGGEVAEDLFERGLCLPSGTAMTNGDLDRVIGTILKSRAKALRG